MDNVNTMSAIITEDKASRYQNTFIFRRHWLATFNELPSDEDRGLLLRAYSDYLLNGSRDADYIKDMRADIQAIYKIMVLETEDSAYRCTTKRNARINK